MKYKTLILVIAIGFAFQSCTKKAINWTGNDIHFPIPKITSISSLKVKVNDTINMQGTFNYVSSVTIGGGYATIDSVSPDSTFMSVKVTSSCSTGPLVVTNVFKNKAISSSNLIVSGGPIVIPDQVTVMDFTDTTKLPHWTRATWKETKSLENKGFDINNIQPPVGYSNYYAMDDTTLYPPNQPAGQDGNIPYGTFSSDNNGAGFDIGFYNDPYVSVLMNTGNDICYMSIVINGKTIDLQSSFSPNGTFANGEVKHYMQTDNKWMWYTFSLSQIMGSSGVPAHINSIGLFIRNSWDYGASNYPGFQLNIANVVITNGPLPRKITVFNFENGSPTTTSQVTSWATDVLPTHALDLSNLTAPQGSHYYSMANQNDGGGKNYKFALKSDNDGQGYDLSKMKNPYISFVVNTGSYSGFLDLVFYQAASGNKPGEPWADPGAGNSALWNYPESTNNGFYYDTKGKWEWRSYSLKKLLNSVPAWGKMNGYPDFNSVFDYILVWPRDGWNNSTAAPPFELNIDDFIITDGVPTRADLVSLN